MELERLGMDGTVAGAAEALEQLQLELALVREQLAAIAAKQQ
jgi:hypothetical protein